MTKKRLSKSAIRTILLWAFIVAFIIWKMLEGHGIEEIVPPATLCLFLNANLSRRKNRLDRH